MNTNKKSDNQLILNIVYDYSTKYNDLKVKLFLKGYNYNIENIEYKLLNKKVVKIKCNKFKSDKDTLFLSKNQLSLSDNTLITLNHNAITNFELISHLKDVENSTLYNYYIIDELKIQEVKNKKLIVKSISIVEREKTKICDILKDKKYSMLDENTALTCNSCVFAFKKEGNLYVSDIDNLTDSDLDKIRKVIFTQYNIFTDSLFNYLYRCLINIKMINRKFKLDIVGSYDTETTNTYINKDIVIDKDYVDSIKDKNKKKKFTDESVSNFAITYNYNFNIINKIYGITFNGRSENDFDKIMNVFEKIFPFKDIITNFYVHNLSHDYYNTITSNYRCKHSFFKDRSTVMSTYIEKIKNRNKDNVHDLYKDKVREYNLKHTKKLKCMTYIVFKNQYVTSNIKLTDSYVMYNKSLANCTKDLPTTNHDSRTLDIFKDVKLKGDLDYTLSRNYKTPLTLKEWNYIYNDTFGLTACIFNDIISLGSIKNLPITQTAKVRSHIKEEYKENSSKKQQDYLRRCLPKEDEREFLENSFAGGYTNGNFTRVGELIKTRVIDYNAEYKGILKIDISSSYPSMMASKKFPYMLKQIYKNKDLNFVMQLAKEHNEGKSTSVIYATFDLKLKKTGKNHDKHSYLLLASVDKHEKCIRDENNVTKSLFSNMPFEESTRIATKIKDDTINLDREKSRKNWHLKRDKDRKKKNYKDSIFNGRLIKCKNYHFRGTIVDLMEYMKVYNITNFVAKEIYVYSVDYLPKCTIDSMANFYRDKTVLKGTEDNINYMNSKEKLNSSYGMMVQKSVKSVYLENEDFSDIEEIPIENEENNIDNQIIFKLFQWGPYITSYARQSIIDMGLNFGDRILYIDTDSCVVLTNNPKEDYKKFIEIANKQINKEVQAVCKYYNIDYNKNFNPANKDGVNYAIGEFDIENKFVYNGKEYSYAELNHYKQENNLDIDVWDYIKLIGAFKHICPKKYTFLDYNVKKDKYELKHTISGVSKESIDNLINEKHKQGMSDIEIMDKVINYGLVIPEGKTGKSRGVISREKFNYVHTDYLGNVIYGTHKMSKSLSPTQFKIHERENILKKDYEKDNKDIIYEHDDRDTSESILEWLLEDE